MSSTESRIETSEELAKICELKGCDSRMKRADDAVSLKTFLTVILSMAGLLSTILAYIIGSLAATGKAIDIEKYDRLIQRQEMTREFTQKLDSIDGKIDSLMLKINGK